MKPIKPLKMILGATAAGALIGGALSTAAAPPGAAAVQGPTTHFDSLAVPASSELPSVSSDGRYVAFVGRSSKSQGVWIYDRLRGTTKRVTTGNDMNPSISPDGRYVAFAHYPSSGTRGRTVQLLDLRTGRQTQQDVASNGTPASGGSALSDFPSVSANGRYVAFMSTATNLGGPSVNGGGPNKVYVHDNRTGKTVMASVTSSNGGVNGQAEWPDITPDGRYVAFYSDASNLVPGLPSTETESGTEEGGSGSGSNTVSAAADDGSGGTGGSGSTGGSGEETTTAGAQQFYVHDMRSGVTTLVSVPTTGGYQLAASAPSTGPSISNDGRYVAFESDAPNLVPGDTNNEKDAFVRDLRKGTTTRVSLTSTGAQATAPVYTYERTASSEGSGGSGGTTTTTTTPGGSQGSGTDTTTTETVTISTAGGAPVISGDGSTVAFQSFAALTPDDQNQTTVTTDETTSTVGCMDVYTYSMTTHKITRESVAMPGGTDASGTKVPGGGSDAGATVPVANGADPAIGLKGNSVTFTSAGNLAANRPVSTEGETEEGSGGSGGSGGTGESAASVSAAAEETTTTSYESGIFTRSQAAQTAGGYLMAASDGGVFAQGNATFHGSLGGVKLTQPVVGMASTSSGNGYYMVASDGGVFAFGDAAFLGSTGGVKLVEPVVGMANLPYGGGYWLVASDGGVFSFGDAAFNGSTGGVNLVKPIVGMAATPGGGGYWLVASDGGVFSFGDATFYGSTGGVNLNKPIVGMAATPDGGGYWLVASDGGVFAFGDASFYGSTGGVRLAQPIIGIASTGNGGGYWMIARDGGVFSYGNGAFHGSLGNVRLSQPIVGATAH